MTEILFKAKRIDNGEWVEGLYIRDIGREKSEGLSHFAHKIMPLYEQAYQEPIILETLCQYTGLTDKNGKMIWENDVIKDNVIFGTVTWDVKNAKFVVDDINDDYQDYSGWWDKVEVIGNIFDNPELLQEGEE